MQTPDQNQTILIVGAKKLSSANNLKPNRGIYAKALAVLQGNHQKGDVVYRYVQTEIE